jgi:hypothetical protein
LHHLHLLLLRPPSPSGAAYDFHVTIVLVPDPQRLSAVHHQSAILPIGAVLFDLAILLVIKQETLLPVAVDTVPQALEAQVSHPLGVAETLCLPRTQVMDGHRAREEVIAVILCGEESLEEAGLELLWSRVRHLQEWRLLWVGRALPGLAALSALSLIRGPCRLLGHLEGEVVDVAGLLGVEMGDWLAGIAEG